MTESKEYQKAVKLNPKEEIIKGLAKLINKLIKDFDNEAHEYPCLLLSKYILTYLSSHGFGDIEQAEKEERERIISELDNDFSLAPFDDSYLRLLVDDTLKTLRTGKTQKQRADENCDRLQAFKPGCLGKYNYGSEDCHNCKFRKQCRRDKNLQALKQEGK